MGEGEEVVLYEEGKCGRIFERKCIVSGRNYCVSPVIVKQ